MWASLAVFLLTIIVLLFGGNNPPPRALQSPDLAGSEIMANGSLPNNFSIPGQTETIGQTSAYKRLGKLSRKFLGPQLLERPSLQKIPPGLIGKAVLTSGASNGPIRAELTEPLDFNGEVFIQEGAVLLGTGASTEERLFIHFDQIVTREGTILSARAEALDPSDKIAGLKGSKIGGHAMKLAGGIGLGFVGGLTEGLQDSDVQGGVAVRSPSLKNAMLNGAATAALDQSRDMMQGLKDKQPIIEVKEGSKVLVIFEPN